MGNGNLIFFGTTSVGIPILERLGRHYRLALIVTQPDARGGRHQQPLVPAVKRFAQERGLPFIQPEKLSDPGLAERIGGLEPLVGIVVAYGKLIPHRLYALPRFRTLNVHFSLLPLWRGAAPVQRAIERGETRTGITIFEIADQLDSGDIWAQQEADILPEDTSETLLERLSRSAADFLMETLEGILSGRLTPRAQDHSQATWAPSLRKEEARVDWNRSASDIYNRWRAFQPWPGLHFTLAEGSERRIAIKKSALAAQSHDLPPGSVIALERSGLKIGCGHSTVIELLEIQPEGKKPMTPFQFSLGNRFPPRLP